MQLITEEPNVCSVRSAPSLGVPAWRGAGPLCLSGPARPAGCPAGAGCFCHVQLLRVQTVLIKAEIPIGRNRGMKIHGRRFGVAFCLNK